MEHNITVKFHTRRIRRSTGEVTGHVLIIFFLALLAFTTIYPFWHVVMYSVSDPKQSMSGGFFFWPRGICLDSYQTLLNTKQLWVSYGNSILVMVIGTLLAIVISAMTAYPLSRKRLKGRGFFSLIIFFTMLFSGGMIPLYLQVSKLGLLDTFWAMVLPGCMSAYNMFILRNFMQGLPDSLEESARLDGANDLTILFKIVMPLCTPSIAAIAMFYGTAYWINYLDCLLYTHNSNLQVLSLYLRSVLNGAASSALTTSSANVSAKVQNITEESIKMTVVAISVIPIVIVYPFLQRFYTKGITVGAVKG